MSEQCKAPVTVEGSFICVHDAGHDGPHGTTFMGIPWEPIPWKPEDDEPTIWELMGFTAAADIEVLFGSAFLEEADVAVVEAYARGCDQINFPAFPNGDDAAYALIEPPEDKSDLGAFLAAFERRHSVAPS